MYWVWRQGSLTELLLPSFLKYFPKCEAICGIAFRMDHQIMPGVCVCMFLSHNYLENQALCKVQILQVSISEPKDVVCISSSRSPKVICHQFHDGTLSAMLSWHYV